MTSPIKKKYPKYLGPVCTKLHCKVWILCIGYYEWEQILYLLIHPYSSYWASYVCTYEYV